MDMGRIEANYPVLVRSRDDSMSSAASHILFTKQYAFVPVFPYCVQKLARYTDVQFKAFTVASIQYRWFTHLCYKMTYFE